VALWSSALLANSAKVWAELINTALLLQIKDDDARGSSGTEPVTVGRENEGVDFVAGWERVQVLGLVQVPEHGGSILST
jgi:hypothetical protein